MGTQELGLLQMTRISLGPVTGTRALREQMPAALYLCPEQPCVRRIQSADLSDYRAPVIWDNHEDYHLPPLGLPGIMVKITTSLH